MNNKIRSFMRLVLLFTTTLHKIVIKFSKVFPVIRLVLKCIKIISPTNFILSSSRIPFKENKNEKCPISFNTIYEKLFSLLSSA